MQAKVVASSILAPHFQFDIFCSNNTDASPNIYFLLHLEKLLSIKLPMLFSFPYLLWKFRYSIHTSPNNKQKSNYFLLYFQIWKSEEVFLFFSFSPFILLTSKKATKIKEILIIGWKIIFNVKLGLAQMRPELIPGRNRPARIWLGNKSEMDLFLVIIPASFNFNKISTFFKN